MVRLKLNLKSRGFSLLEVIIAVGILSTGIVIILQALSFSARVTGLSSDITKAIFLAEDKIQELEFKEKRNQITDSQENDQKDKFQWSYTIALVPDLELYELYKLDFDIKWQRLNREEKITLNTYLKNLQL